MKSKRLIRFYFSADILNGAIDNLITANALKSEEFIGGGEYYAGRIIKLINIKRELNGLWLYLDGVMGGLSESERVTLEFYGGLRVGIKSLDGKRAKEIKRVTVKFTRRARNVGRYAEALRLLGEYYCLLSPAD